MIATTHVTTKGQIVIPKRVRELLHWRPGLKLEVENRDGGVVWLRPQADDIIDQAFGCMRAGDPLGDLEREHLAEIGHDEHKRRR